MSISIIDNFQVGTSKPIDNRFVVGPGLYYTNKNDIQHKYTGLRIWDINDDKSYIWKDTVWVEESTFEVVGTGTTGAIPKFTTSTTIGDSIMTESTGRINVNGILQATSLVGSGSGITAINATNITTGTLNPARLVGGSNEVLVGNGTGSTWANLNTLTVGTSNKVSLLNSVTSNVAHYLTFASANSSSQQLFSNVSLAYQPSSGNLSISTTDFNNKLTVNGSVSIGTTIAAPDSGLLVGGSVRFTGLSQIDPNLNLPKLVVTTDTTGVLKLDTGSTLPLGAIIMWSGLEETIPTGFAICNGCSYVTMTSQAAGMGQIITPDLRQKFLFGAGNSPTINSPTPLDIGQESTFDYSNTGDNNITYRSIYYIMYIGYPIIDTQCG